MDFDEILEEIGEFGKFQYINFFFISLPIIYVGANSLPYVFTTRSPNYRCFVPECESIENTNYNADWVKDVLPGSISEATGHFVPEICHKYSFNNTNVDANITTCAAQIFKGEREKCSSWVFEKGDRTIVNDWNLTCHENHWKLALVGSVHFAGVMAGSGIFGILADYYGRKIPMIIAIALMSLTGIAQILANNYLTFLILTFFNAIGSSGVYPPAFVLCFEMVGRSKRVAASVVLNYFYSLGGALTGMIAWLVKDWVLLLIWISVPPILFVSYYWFVPESPRWLLAKKRHQKALVIIQKAAKLNGVELSQNTLTRFEQEDAKEVKEAQTVKSPESNQDESDMKAVTYRDLMKSKILLFRCLIFFFIWGANAFVFYGLSVNAVNLSGNIYFNFILGSLSEMLGNFISHIVMNKYGRKYSQIFSLLICGVVCIVGGFIPAKVFWIQIVMYVVGKMTITTSFTIVILHSSEMLPTLIRSGVVGTLSTLSRSGALLAPFVPLLKFVYAFLPLLIFGSVAFIAGLSGFFLPETLGIKLPDTIEEAENIGRKKNDDITKKQPSIQRYTVKENVE